MVKDLRKKVAYYIKLNSLNIKMERQKIKKLDSRIKEIQSGLNKNEITEELYWLKAELDLYYNNLYTYEMNRKYYENFIW